MRSAPGWIREGVKRKAYAGRWLGGRRALRLVEEDLRAEIDGQELARPAEVGRRLYSFSSSSRTVTNPA